MDIAESLNNKLVRMQLSDKIRKDIYTLLAFMLANRVQVIDALRELHAIYSADGKKPKSGPAVFLYEALQRTKEGKPLSEAFARYISPAEASMIAAGERSGRLREAFISAIDNLTRQKTVKNAVWAGSAYPAVLSGLLGLILWMVSYKLMPQLVKTVDISMLSGPALYLYHVSHIFTTQGIYYGVGLAIIAAWVAWSLPNVTGNLRYHLDKWPPYSVYRAMQGTTFLLNVSVMLRSGIKLLDILQMLEQTSTPYMRERIQAAIRGTNAGLNLGESLAKAELDFPDPTAVRLIRVFAARDGFDTALNEFAKDWAESTVDRVKKAMNGVFYVALVGVGATLILLATAIGEITSVLQSAAG